MEIPVEISLLSDRVADLANQQELIAIREALAQFDPVLVPLNAGRVRDAVAKSGEVEILAGSVQVILPTGVLVAALTTLIRQHFTARRRRGLRLTRSDGSSLEIRGYSAEETTAMIKSFFPDAIVARDSESNT